MEDVRRMLDAARERLVGLAKANAVVATPISVGERHVIPLCELGVGFGAGGGVADAASAGESGGAGQGEGGGAGGGVKATPVAVVVIDNGSVRVESLR